MGRLSCPRSGTTDPSSSLPPHPPLILWPELSIAGISDECSVVVTMILTWSLLLTLLHTSDQYQITSSPIIESIVVPGHIVSGSDTVLKCVYSYHSSPYSVRWYRNGKEFYSYVGDKSQPVSVHPAPGVTVDLSRSGQTQVALVAVTLETTGRYRCEVSGQAPMFATDTRYSDLSVVTAPDTGPSISGARDRYQVGDMVSINCSVTGSRPAANITWFINNNQVKNILVTSTFNCIYLCCRFQRSI